ncbi:hypothetical protein [Scatolibacter rhodanostii]|uniref:hypothetical protein n=1 Tax=Scatolibacter rhodanostii TaxID=2014781 RepID=UPI000C07ED76|nr:hypothetical protein [Scatolibacter rhodanostii]
MSRYIDVDSLREEILHENEYDSDITNHYLDLIDFTDDADVAEVVRGEWLNFIGDFSTAECSKCGEIYEVSPEEPRNGKEFFDAFKQFYRFCPHCGARMNKPATDTNVATTSREFFD